MPSEIKIQKNSKKVKNTNAASKSNISTFEKEANTVGQPSVFVSLSAMARFYLATSKRAYRPCWNSLLLSDPTGLLEQQVLITVVLKSKLATDFFLLAKVGVLHRPFKVN